MSLKFLFSGGRLHNKVCMPRRNNNPYSLAFMCIFSALLSRYFMSYELHAINYFASLGIFMRQGRRMVTKTLIVEDFKGSMAKHLVRHLEKSVEAVMI